MPTIDRNVRIHTPDGFELSTDIYHPDGKGICPTLLQRTCYGKEAIGEFSGIDRLTAAGYRVVIQDCRGSGSSSGDAGHFFESADGRTTGDWIAAQPWFDGQLGTFGVSYMGFTQWALAATRPPYLKAMAVGFFGAKGGESWFPGGSFALDICLPWTMTMVFGFMEAQTPEGQAKLKAGFDHLPLGDADLVATGQHVPWFQRWIEHPSADDPYWKPLNFTHALDLDIPILMLDAWYDYATVRTVRDFSLRQAAGAPRRLHIGPGTHFESGEKELDETLRWFDRHLKGIDSYDDIGPVSVFVMPDLGWRELESWPPPAGHETWWLQPGGGLEDHLPSESEPTPYTYDPGDPTPAVGGPSLRMDNCGPMDNRRLEARQDVLTFTTEPLSDAALVIGAVNAQLYLSSDLDHFDIYLRLCDVAPTGESINICDVIRRLTPNDIHRDEQGVFDVSLDMWPTAQSFAPGHRIRLQLSSGAHPMFARNTGSGEPLASAAAIKIAHNTVHHEPAYASRLTLPRADQMAAQTR